MAVIARRHLPLHRELAFDAYLTVIDVQPALTYDEARAALSQQCAECNIVGFLQGLSPAANDDGLSGLRALFANLGAVGHALARGRGEEIVELARRMHMPKVWEIVYPGALPTLGLPCAHVLGPDASSVVVRERDVVVLPPHLAHDAQALVARWRRRGVTSLLLGYLEHAAAMDGLASFAERDDLHELVLTLRAEGFERLGYAMAFPPCASFMWPENRPLEAMRARIDLQFRRLEADGPLICSENVSGYGLVRDAEFASELLPRGRSRAVRIDRLLFMA
jgi:hypothetical protein